MAVRTVKARVEIDGEKQYKDAIAEINRDNKVLASEMRKLQAEYKGNADSMEFLTKKGDILDRQLLEQKAKVAETRKAFEEWQQKLEEVRTEVGASSDAYKAAQAKVAEWQTRLNDAEAAQYELQHAIEENNEALSGQEEEMSGLGDTMDDLAGKLGVQIPDAAKKALNGMGDFSAGAVKKLGLVVTIIAAVIQGIKKIDALTKEAAANADDILTNSSITGLSEGTLQELKYAENLIDVSADAISGSLSKLTRSMASAKDGNADMRRSFAELGVSVVDAGGQLRSAEDVFYDVIDALGQIPNETERDAAAMALLGKSAQELNPLIEQGTATLRKYQEEAHETGYVLSHDELAALGAVDDAYQRLQLTVEASKNQLALDFAPSSEKAFELFADAVQSASDILEKSGLADTLGLILSDVLDILQNIIDVTNAIPGLDQGLGILKVTLGAVAQFCALIADASDAITGLLTLDWTKFKNAFGAGYNSGNPNNWQRTYMIQDGTYEQYRDFYNSPYYTYYSGNNASGNTNWRGGLTYLGENGPEAAILPRGTRILSAQDTAQLGGGDTYNFTVNVRDLEDLEGLIRWAKGARVRGRMR